SLAGLVPANGMSNVDLLLLAASAERGSEHPVAAAIVKAAEERKIALLPAEHFQSFAGKGIGAEVQGRKVLVGNGKFLEDYGIDLKVLRFHADALEQKGQTVVWVAVDGKAAGVIGVADALKGSTSEVVRSLRQSGLRIMMITGDSQAAAQSIAQELGMGA